MNNLSKVLLFKIVTTITAWCIPLLLFPASLLVSLGFPEQESYMFVRMLGWAYLALCVGYGFALHASLKGKRLMGSIWVGIVSNGGAWGFLMYYGLTGAWSEWGIIIQWLGWGSVAATFLITVGLITFGVRSEDPIVS